MTAACDRCGRSSPRLRRGLCAACYGTRRERDIAYGRWESQRVPADPVRAHVAALRAAGYDTETVRQACRDFISSPNYWRRSLRIWVTPPEPPTGEQVCPEVGQ